METRKKQKPSITQVLRQDVIANKGVDTKKFCGILKLKEDPLATQKRLRDEWR